MRRTASVVLVSLVALVVLPIAPAYADTASKCGGRVTAILASSGYTPATLAPTTPQANSATVRQSIEAGCDAGLPEQEIAATTLVAASVPPGEIAGFLTAAFHQDAAAVAATLRSVGLDAAQIAVALSTTFATTADNLAAILASLGFTATDTAGALVLAHGTGAMEGVRLLRVHGFGAADVASALRDVFQETPETSAELLLVAFGTEEALDGFESLAADVEPVAFTSLSAESNAWLKDSWQ